MAPLAGDSRRLTILLLHERYCLVNILIVAFEAGRWGPARLVKPLVAAGFSVAALCPTDNAVARTGFLDRHFPLRSVKSSRHIEARLAEAMAAWQPDLIVPADERVVACLHALVRRAGEGKVGRLSAADVAIIVRSLGNPDRFDAMLFKSSTVQVARDAGVRVPDGGTVRGVDDAVALADRVEYPVYVKTSFSWAGNGVTLCRDASAVAAAVAAAHAPRRTGLRGMIRRMLSRDWYPTAGDIDIQKAVDGSPAMYCVLAIGGKVVAGFAGEARQTSSATGPSSVVWIGAHDAMARASATMVGALGITGFVGFDFMLEHGTGAAYLLECNPRPIQVGHLGARIGVDLGAALAAAMRGETVRTQPEQEAVVRLFPQEWRRDPTSLDRDTADCDVPWDDPSLVREMIGTVADPSKVPACLMAYLPPSDPPRAGKTILWPRPAGAALQ